MAYSRLALTATALLACLASAYGDALLTFCASSRDITPGGEPSPLCTSLAGVSWNSLNNLPIKDLANTPGTLDLKSWNWGLRPATGAAGAAAGRPTFNTVSFRYEDNLPNQLINAALSGRSYSSMLILEVDANSSTPITAWYFINVSITAMERNFSASNAVSWDIALRFDSARHYVFGPNAANDVATPQVPRTCIPSNAPGCFNVPTA